MSVENKQMNPAEKAAEEALAEVLSCIDKKQSFVLEAGAGAGKTHSLVHSLRHLIKTNGKNFLRNKQRIACITYTNVASQEIESRTDSHPVVFSATIHSFCYDLIKDFQADLRKAIPGLSEKWKARLQEAGVDDLGQRQILYDLGYPKVTDKHVWLGHNDVLLLVVELMKYPKFLRIFTNRYPVVFIDEYQDTDAGFAQAIKTHFLDTGTGPLLGFFGDHWQKIYETGCGNMEHAKLKTIGKKANFRSVKTIVDLLNKIRPDLPQEVRDPNSLGSATVYHTNNWQGNRLTNGHWKGDLPAAEAHQYRQLLKETLAANGWDFSPGTTKILMLTNNVLAEEQGYKTITDVFRYSDSYLKLEDPYLNFLGRSVEPVCTAYEQRNYGLMFSLLDSRTTTIRSHVDKSKWAGEMDKLVELRKNGTIGNVIDYLKQTRKPRLSEKIEEMESQLAEIEKNPPEEVPERIVEVKSLRDVKYAEIIALTKYVDEQTLFSTKHGVKGAEFENVLVIIGRGWNLYNFDQMLQWIASKVPNDKQSTFERNRNLFYVACSRAKKRLALLFTQELSADALKLLTEWFGEQNVHTVQ